MEPRREMVETSKRQETSSKDEDYELLVLLNDTQTAIHKLRSKELSGFGISPIGAMVLSSIANTSVATPTEISRRVFREPQTISVLLGRMENKGLVRRSNDLERKTLVRVAMTKKGWQAYYLSTGRESIHRTMSSLSEEERQQLSSCLRKLREKALRDLLEERLGEAIGGRLREENSQNRKDLVAGPSRRM